MTTKNVCVIVEDKVVSVDSESIVLDTWSFDDAGVWAIQWYGATKTGDIEPAPVDGVIGANVDLTESDYDTKVKPYVDAWEVQKAKIEAIKDEIAKQQADELAVKIAHRAEVRKLGKIPIVNQVAKYPKGVDSI